MPLFNIFLAGNIVQLKLPMIEAMNIAINCPVGNSKVKGKFVNSTLCIVIVHDRIVPIMRPTNELLRIRINASDMYMKIKTFLGTPRALYIVISLVCSKMLIDMEADRLKKQKIKTMMLINPNRKLIRRLVLSILVANSW